MKHDKECPCIECGARELLELSEQDGVPTVRFAQLAGPIADAVLRGLTGKEQIALQIKNGRHVSAMVARSLAVAVLGEQK